MGGGCSLVGRATSGRARRMGSAAWYRTRREGKGGRAPGAGCGGRIAPAPSGGSVRPAEQEDLAGWRDAGPHHDPIDQREDAADESRPAWTLPRMSNGGAPRPDEAPDVREAVLDRVVGDGRARRGDDQLEAGSLEHLAVARERTGGGACAGPQRADGRLEQQGRL